MSKRIFTKEQIKQLLENKNVLKCSEKSITYSKKFKINAIKQYQEEYLSPNEIFKKAAFDINIIGRSIPKDCLQRWRRIFKEKGIDGLKESRGSKKGISVNRKDLTDKEKIVRMEAEIAYLKAENDFLAKLRAKRAE